MRVNTNGLSYSTIGQLNSKETTHLQGSSLEKLSAGYRINRDSNGAVVSATAKSIPQDSISISTEAQQAYQQFQNNDKLSASQLDDAINRVSTQKSSLAAIHEHTIRLGVTGVNLRDVDGATRLRDDDVATRMVSFIPSGVAMLSQANRQPQQALQLLG